ncbi:hypothetical protein FACS1894177_07850 [Bacteroidia bacterium]|nr:hypothetical protein FACS1894177_07850 [Bacteroidia bacterium]
MDDETNESEPEGKGELKGGHSPFGVMWRVQKETGWTDEYLLWQIPWVNVRMKLIDEIPYEYNGKSAKTIENEDELIEFLNENER